MVWELGLEEEVSKSRGLEVSRSRSLEGLGIGAWVLGLAPQGHPPLLSELRRRGRHLSFTICHLSFVTGPRYFNGLRNLYSANSSIPTSGNETLYTCYSDLFPLDLKLSRARGPESYR